MYIENKLKELKNSVVIRTSNINEFINKAKEFILKDEVESIYAVGGDGTVNLLANLIINSNKKLGIVPIGKHNKIYNSINNTKHIDIGYINDKLFLNQAILFKDLSYIDYSLNDESLKKLKSFEIVSNITGKYKILETNSLVISNGKFANNLYNLNDGKMETYIIKNDKRLFNKKDILVGTSSFNVDTLGSTYILIDGDLYSISEFSFKVLKNGIDLALPISKKLQLLKK